MNLELLQSYGQGYPENCEGLLDCGSEALTCAFNRRGTLLAVGCNDGRVVVWDFLTRGIAKSYTGHTHPITSLSWNRNGATLLSTSMDWNVCLWDVRSGECQHKIRFHSPVMKAQFNPRNKSQFLVCTMKQSPSLVLVTGKEEPDIKPLPTDDEPEVSIVGAFHRRGESVVTGSSKGKILIIDPTTRTMLKSFRIGGSTIRSVEFARRGSRFLVNSSDRVIRVYDIKHIMGLDEDSDPEPIQKLQDTVNRTQWKKCCFSGDGEYLVGGSYHHHSLYIWDQATWSLVKILTGQKGESLLDVAWHPVRPIIASIARGVVNIWSQAVTENWSAYAPDFKELEENEEYEERESEFDIEDEDKDKMRAVDSQNAEDAEDDTVDIETVPPIPAFCSSDDEDDEEHLDWLSIAPEMDEPEEPGWGQLEPALNDYQNEPSDTKIGSSSVAPGDDPSPSTVEFTDPREEGDSPPPVKRKKMGQENGAGPDQ